MSNKLSLMPNIAIPRSRFPQTFNHSFDCFHGDLVPTDAFEVVAGDEFSYTLKSLIRMSTPIVPIMGNIKCRVDAWFVPLRLIWSDAEKFYGDPSNHDTIASITPVNPTAVTIPSIQNSGYCHLDTSDSSFVPFLHSVQDYLGKVDLKAVYSLAGSSANFSAWLSKVNVSTLKEKAYLTIWNDGYRPSLMVPPVLVNKGSSSPYGTASFLSNSNLKYPFKPLKAFKQYDYFTAGTLSPQYGSAVALPLGSTAPVGAVLNNGGIASATTVGIELGNAGSAEFRNVWVDSTNASDGPSNLLADLSLATAASINEIRYAFQLQKYFERSNYGNRYFEILNAHYGITNPDSRLQRAERLGSHEFYINVSQVVSTADTESGTTGQNLGNTGAVSVTGDKCHLFTKSFSEPGYIMVLMTMKYDRSYASGFLREDIKKNRFEFYSPEFANLGDQATKAIEIHIKDSNNELVDPDSVHSYNEHWAEYRYRKDRVSGLLRPGQSLDIWTLADDFDGVDATPGYTFLAEDRTALARVLASGSAGPDYIVDTNASIIATRELPLYSIPGLIDHFGAL